MPVGQGSQGPLGRRYSEAFLEGIPTEEQNHAKLIKVPRPSSTKTRGWSSAGRGGTPRPVPWPSAWAQSLRQRWPRGLAPATARETRRRPGSGLPSGPAWVAARICGVSGAELLRPPGVTWEQSPEPCSSPGTSTRGRGHRARFGPYEMLSVVRTFGIRAQTTDCCSLLKIRKWRLARARHSPPRGGGVESQTDCVSTSTLTSACGCLQFLIHK